MIDDDFSPTRIQLFVLGHLLHASYVDPKSYAPTLEEIYSLSGDKTGSWPILPDWLREMTSLNLLALDVPEVKFTRQIGAPYEPIRLRLTPQGTFFTVSRAMMIAENARTPTHDFPDEIIETASAIYGYYGSKSDDFVPAADRSVTLDHNSKEFHEALEALDAVSVALRNNKFGAEKPEIRDEKLEELRKIRSLLEAPEVSVNRVQAVAWGVLAYLATQFASEPVGIAAHIAWEKIAVLLGLI